MYVCNRNRIDNNLCGCRYILHSGGISCLNSLIMNNGLYPIRQEILICSAVQELLEFSYWVLMIFLAIARLRQNKSRYFIIATKSLGCLRQTSDLLFYIVITNASLSFLADFLEKSLSSVTTYVPEEWKYFECSEDTCINYYNVSSKFANGFLNK